MAFESGIAEAEPSHWEDPLGQFQYPGDGGGVIAQHANRAAAEARRLGRQDKDLHHECGVDGGVEEAFEPGVGRRVAMQDTQPFEAARIAAEHQEHRRIADPWHIRNERGEPVAASPVADTDDRGLLKIRFGRGGKGGPQQQPQQFLGNRAIGVAAMGAPQQGLAQPGQVQEVFGRRRGLAKARLPFLARRRPSSRRHQPRRGEAGQIVGVEEIALIAELAGYGRDSSCCISASSSGEKSGGFLRRARASSGSRAPADACEHAHAVLVEQAEEQSSGGSPASVSSARCRSP